MSENNKNNDISALHKQLNEIAERLNAAKERLDALPKKPEPKSANNDMVFFSLDSSGMEFHSNVPTEFGGEQEEKEDLDIFHNPISPDMAEFFLAAGTLLQTALYMPFADRSGRLSDFFRWVSTARGCMVAENFAPIERDQFTAWCKSAAKVLNAAQRKHGLWLTDSEENLVATMANGEMWKTQEQEEGDSDDDTL